MYPTITQYIDAIGARKSNFEELRKVALILDHTGEPLYTTTKTTVRFSVRIEGVECSLRVFMAGGREEYYAQREGARHYGQELAVVVGSEGEMRLFDVIVEGEQRLEEAMDAVENPPREISENRRAKVGENGLWGYVDQDENWAIEPEWDEVSDFCEGRAVVEKEGMMGLIDTSGNAVLPLDYDELSYDHSHLCYTNKMGLCGVMDRCGNQVVEHCWDWTAEFANGRLLVQKDQLFGYVDQMGNTVIEPKYTHANSFDHNGVAKVVLRGQTLVIDTDGFEIS